MTRRRSSWRIVHLMLLSALSALVAGMSYGAVLAGLSGDVNGDGRADALDALIILQTDAGMGELVQGGEVWDLVLPPVWTLNRTGCATDGLCLRDEGPGATRQLGTWRADLLELVVRPETSLATETHELCHAHQHMTINGGATSGTPWQDWDETNEGMSYQLSAMRETGPWAVGSVSEPTGWLENFAGRCSDWVLRPAVLQANAPVTYRWFEEHIR